MAGMIGFDQAGSLQAQARSPAPAPRAALVVLVTVDQLRGDYLLRFKSQWRGGFARLLATGRVYPRALQDHAITETAPGHATLLSGRDPAHTGIPTNRRGVPDPSFPVLGAPGAGGASPRRFVGTTLVDWMRARDSSTQFLSVSRKDRGAILPIGRSRGPVFWYANGRFTTSRYYADSLPDWVDEFNSRLPFARLAGTDWTLLLDSTEYAEPDAMPFENGGRDITFPHSLPPTADAMTERLPDTPWMDSLTLALALAGVGRLGLGQGPGANLLAVSLSATDEIGHAYGPDSREVHDQLLRLDRWLGRFFDSLSTDVGGGRLLLVLTADHGVVSFPEYARLRGRPGGRIAVDALIGELGRGLTQRFGGSFALDFDSGLLTADVDRLRAKGIPLDSLAAAWALRLRALPGVSTVYTARTLAAARPSDTDAARWRRTLPVGFGWIICAAVAPGYIWAEGTSFTTHGTGNPDDVTVPIGFLGEGVRPGLSLRSIRTTDIAPTVAAWLGVMPLESLDGAVVRDAFRVRH